MMDLTRHAKRYGVTFRANPFFPINTLVLMRGAVGVQMHQSERLEAYLAAVFKAIWVDAQDLNQPALVAQTLQAAGFDPAQLLALSGQTDVKNQLRQTTEEAVARGVFGAPTLFVGDGMFFGQDRLDMVREALG
jgi:2-hydroxychromene-2-carboxylate isomerase